MNEVSFFMLNGLMGSLKKIIKSVFIEGLRTEVVVSCEFTLYK